VVALGITILAIAVAALTIALIANASRTAAVVAAALILALVTVDYLAASSGLLRDWARRPPPLMIAVAVPTFLALAATWSRFGTRLAAANSFAAIIAVQSFRLPLELVMHQAATSGLMPVQMSYSGWNFDIVTGILAIPVALIAQRPDPPRALIAIWNTLGTVLLINIVTIAIASTPLFAAFGRDHLNTWVTDPPYVFLPAVLVPAAVFGHALTWRKLAAGRMISS
jgi:hypothetical protein